MLAWVVVGEEEVDCVSVGVVGLRSSARDDVACRNGVGMWVRCGGESALTPVSHGRMKVRDWGRGLEGRG